MEMNHTGGIIDHFACPTSVGKVANLIDYRVTLSHDLLSCMHGALPSCSWYTSTQGVQGYPCSVGRATGLS